MILEILLPIPLNNKTFYYNTGNIDEKKIRLGSLVKVDFRKKNYVGLVIKKHKKINFKKKLLNIKVLYNKLCFTNELIQSMFFLSNYTCNQTSLIFKKFLTGFSEENEIEDLNFKKIASPKLSQDQKKTLEKLNTNEKTFKVFTLNGVTGSGKTRVYMYIVKEILKNGFQCLVMVPEIILTKEWVKEIEQDFSISAEVFHSSISIKKRRKIWFNLISGVPMLIIGTRSSLFLPFKKLGVIVVDEEHDQSYKQEDQLIINARDFAIVRAKNSSCPIILSSATPSIETIHNCKNKKFTEVKLLKRISNISMPKLHLIDMKNEKNLISEKLESVIKENLKKNLQTMLFINRRGYTSYVICKKCNFIKSCPNCDVSLVLHNFMTKKETFFLCHHCSHKEKFENQCHNCHSKNSLQFPGEGIEKIFEEISKKFPESKKIIISSDLTKNTNNLKKILENITENKVDIIVGTQIISKGHNFPFLKSVGILNIDNLLNDFDFRSFEKSFQQIVQVSGRAGRKDFIGNVLIQTIQPKHPVLKFCKDNKFEDFYNWELKKREINNQPPFFNYISLIISGKKHPYVKNFSKSLFESIKISFGGCKIFGPAPAVISLKNKKYRYRILIKIEKNIAYQNDIKKFLKNIKVPPSLKLYIDVDPISFL